MTVRVVRFTFVVSFLASYFVLRVVLVMDVVMQRVSLVPVCDRIICLSCSCTEVVMHGAVR